MRRSLIPNIWNFILIALCTAFAFGRSASEKYISLNGNWQFKSESDQKWMEAKVPGDVHLDLLTNKVIGDPLYADNAAKCEWIEQKTWIYKKNFAVPQRFIRDRVELLFKGLDLDAEIFLNGLKVAEHHNAFVPCAVDVTGRLRNAANELIVHIDVGRKRVKDKPFRTQYHPRTAKQTGLPHQAACLRCP